MHKNSSNFGFPEEARSKIRQFLIKRKSQEFQKEAETGRQIGNKFADRNGFGPLGKIFCEIGFSFLKSFPTYLEGKKIG